MSSSASTRVATALPGEHDLNFRLDAATPRYVLKLHAPRADLALEDAVLEHLRDVPAVPRLAGGGASDDGRTVRLLSWLDGRPWADAAATWPSLGRAVARVDRALRDFDHPRCAAPTAGTCATRPSSGSRCPSSTISPTR